ncbi:MAG: CsbD family protein [Acidobacteria bacterium]|nr:CsbD family protein [Acidobacteriota bacterium]
MLNREELKGRVKQIMGAIKENLGWLTDDHKAEDDGKAERLEGDRRQHDARVIRQADGSEGELGKRRTDSK